MLESPCCRLSLWQGRCQDGAGEGWHAVERHGGDKNIPASSQGAFPPLFLQPMLLQKSKSHHQFLEQLGVPVTPQHLNQVTRGKLFPFPFPFHFLFLFSFFLLFYSNTSNEGITRGCLLWLVPCWLFSEPVGPWAGGRQGASEIAVVSCAVPRGEPQRWFSPALA